VELGPAAKDVCQLGFEAEAEEVEEVDEKGIEAEKEGSYPSSSIPILRYLATFKF
jgi:hypothetical protein